MKEYLTRRLDDGHTWYYLCDTIINIFLLLIVKAVHHSKEFMMKLKLKNKYDNPYFSLTRKECNDNYNYKVLYY